MVCDTNSFAWRARLQTSAFNTAHSRWDLWGSMSACSCFRTALPHDTAGDTALAKVRKDHRSRDVFSGKGTWRLPGPISPLQQDYCQHQSRYWKPSSVGIPQPPQYLLQHCTTPWMKHLTFTGSIAKKRAVHPDVQDTDEDLKISLVFLCNRWLPSYEHTHNWYLFVFWWFSKAGSFFGL